MTTNNEDEWRRAIRAALKDTQEALFKLSDELQKSRVSHERVAVEIENISREVDRARGTIESLGARVTTIEAQASGASSAGNSAATWITVALALAGTVISLVVALTQ